MWHTWSLLHKLSTVHNGKLVGVRETSRPVPLQQTQDQDPNVIRINDNDNRRYAKVQLFGVTKVGLLDSGSTCTILGKGALEFLNEIGLKMEETFSLFIPNFSIIVAPIADLIQGDRKVAKIEWTTQAEKAFQEIKKLLTTPPVLSNPSYERTFFVHSDASDVGVGDIWHSGLMMVKKLLHIFLSNSAKYNNATQPRKKSVSQFC
jgi:RNase H-like domain found in reverse transcriptase